MAHRELTRWSGFWRRVLARVTWFKVDDSFYDHTKVFDAPDCAVALWTRAGSWSARNLTEGFVPTGMPARLCGDPDTAVADLLRRGLWLRASGGYRFHDWEKYQPSKAQVEDLRAKRAAAGRKGGLAKAGKQTASKSQASASPVGKQNATPTRPPLKGGGSPGSKGAAGKPHPFDESPASPGWCVCDMPRANKIHVQGGRAA